MGIRFSGITDCAPRALPRYARAPRVLTHPRNDGENYSAFCIKKGSAFSALPVRFYLRRSPKPSKYTLTKMAITILAISSAPA